MVGFYVSLDMRLGGGAGGMVATDGATPALHLPHHIHQNCLGNKTCSSFCQTLRNP